MTTPGEDRAYDLGERLGEIKARLDGHDKHFDSNNGSLIEIKLTLNQVLLELQRQRDGSVADKATVVAKAEAVEADRVTRERNLEHRRMPLNRSILVLTGVGTIVAIIVAVTRYMP